MRQRRFPHRPGFFHPLAALPTGLLLLAGALAVGGAEPLFREDFSKLPVGAPPDAFLILEGQFEVKEGDGNRFLELPGAPLESMGIMFGPAKQEDWSAQARFSGTGQGRRFPVFGVSVNGQSGYRVQVTPARKALELFKGEESKASVPFEWTQAGWTHLRVQIRKVGAAWKVEGKAWKEGAAEPAAWMISWEETETPIPGRVAVWGKPFSGTPIRFDDLMILPATK